MHRKKFSIHKAFSVLLLTIIIFSVGVIIGNQTSHQKVDKVLELSQELQIQTRSFEVQYDILEENICLNEEVLFLTEDLFELSEKIDFMENSLGSDNQQIQEVKEQYFIVEAKHWLLAKKRVDECFKKDIDANHTIVLYFYSNEGDCNRCQQQGAVISYLHEIYSGMKVYSFDIKSDSPVVNVIKKLYAVDETVLPAMIINDETHQGFLDSDELIGFINNQIEEKNNSTEPIETEV